MNRETGSEMGGLVGIVSGCERILISMRWRSVSVKGDTPNSISKMTQPVLLRSDDTIRNEHRPGARICRSWEHRTPK